MIRKSILVLLGLCTLIAQAEIAVKDGDKIVFMGDSITQFGARPDGYVRLVENGLKANGINAVIIPKGASGQMSSHMLARTDRDVVGQQPQWLILSCGVNDANMGSRGVDLEGYKKNINAILDKAAEAGIKVVLLTPSVINRENLSTPGNKHLEGYCEFLRETARLRNLLLADVNAEMRNVLKTPSSQKDFRLTVDGLHMNGYGNQMMAASVLKALGIPEENIAKLLPEWNKIPSMMPVNNNLATPSFLINIDDYVLLNKEAQAQNITVGDLVQKIIKNHIEELKK